MADPPDITICLLGDVMLGRKVAEEIAGEPERAWSSEVLEITQSADLVIANHECCLSARGRPTSLIAGKPFYFRGPPAMVRALTVLGGNVAVGLANNHALDYGTDALADTLEIVSGAGVAVTGADRGEGEARQGAVLSAAGARVGLLAISDHPVEFAATDEGPGIAYADLRRGVPVWVTEEIARLREATDLVIAFPHWGPNMTSEPAPWQKSVATELQAAGADLVAGHSAHVFHGLGWGDAGPVLFDLGDALDDYAVDARLRNDLGLLALWRPGGDPEIELVGLTLDYGRTRLARDADAEWIANRLATACPPLGSEAERLAEQRFAVRPRFS